MTTKNAFGSVTRKEFGVIENRNSEYSQYLIAFDFFTNQFVKLDSNKPYKSTVESLIRCYGIKVNLHHYLNDEAWLAFKTLYDNGIHKERVYDSLDNYEDEFEPYELLLDNQNNKSIWSKYGLSWLLDIDLLEELRGVRVFDTIKAVPVIASGLVRGQYWQGGKLQNHHATSDGNHRKGQVKLSEGALVYSNFVKEVREIKVNQSLDKWFEYFQKEVNHSKNLEDLQKQKYNDLLIEKEENNEIEIIKTKRVKPTRDQKGWTEIKVGSRARKLNAGCDCALPPNTSRIYGSGSGMYGHYRFVVEGNLLCFQPDKGQLIVVAKIKIDFGDINRYYLEWLPGVRLLTSEQRENAQAALGMCVSKRKVAELELSIKSAPPPLLAGVEQAIMWERSKDLIVPPAKKEPKPEYYSGKVLTHKNGSQMSKHFRKLKELGISFTKVDKYTLVID